MKNKYSVIVGNVGTVYDGENGFKAIQEYNAYVTISRAGSGRAGNEHVTLFKNGDVFRAWTPDRWNYEYTDTFSGEANYSWVKRGTVTVKPGASPVRAVKRALQLENVPFKRTDYGDEIRLDERGACRVLFITWNEGG